MLPHSSADIEVHLINADGSEAEISGNGTRCVAAYLFSEQGKEKITIQTGAGLKTCTLTSRSDWEYEFEMAMGSAEVNKEIVVKTQSAETCGIPVSTGNPHYVIFVEQFPNRVAIVSCRGAAFIAFSAWSERRVREQSKASTTCERFFLNAAPGKRSPPAPDRARLPRPQSPPDAPNRL